MKVITHHHSKASNWLAVPAYSSTIWAVMVSYAEELGRNEGKREEGGEVDEGRNCLCGENLVQQVIQWLCANEECLGMYVWGVNTPVSGTDTQAWRRWSTPPPWCRAGWSESRCIGSNCSRTTAADPSGWTTWGLFPFLGRAWDQNVSGYTNRTFLPSLITLLKTLHIYSYI